MTSSISAKLKGYLPSRGWAIFWTILGGTSGSMIYDKRQCSQILKEYKEKAQKVGALEKDWNSPNRKVYVFVEPTSWSPYWFEEFAKPIFDAGALDYELIEPDHPSGIIEKVREIMWNARELHQQEKLKSASANQAASAGGGWFSFSSRPKQPVKSVQEEQKELQEELTRRFLPHLYKPLYDPKIGLVGLGAIPWRHLLYGIEEGSLTSLADEGQEKRQPRDPKHLMSHEIQYPVLGYITGQDLSGWSRFPRRIVGWFSKRFMARQVAQDSLALVNSQVRPFEARDWELGSDDFRPYPKKKEKETTPADTVAQTWTEEAENRMQIDPAVAERLKIINRP